MVTSGRTTDHMLESPQHYELINLITSWYAHFVFLLYFTFLLPLHVLVTFLLQLVTALRSSRLLVPCHEPTPLYFDECSNRTNYPFDFSMHKLIFVGQLPSIHNVNDVRSRVVHHRTACISPIGQADEWVGAWRATWAHRYVVVNPHLVGLPWSCYRDA